MERGVEAGDLRQPGQRRRDRPDAGEVVRLMERRQRAERVEPGEHRIVDPNRRAEIGAAVDHPVTDPEQAAVAEELAYPLAEDPEVALVTGLPIVGPALLGEHPARGIPGDEAGAVPIPSIWPLADRLSGATP